MTFTEAKEIFLNRGWIEVEGGRIFDGKEWREACVVISEWLKQESSEDTISRHAVIDTIESWLSCDDYNEAERHIMKAMQSVLYDLPPVTSQPKMGQWIFVDEAKEHARCSECDYGDVDLFDGRPHNYCSNCGAKMQEAEE